MRRKFIFIVLFFGLTAFKTDPVEPFKSGEYLKFKLYYNLFPFTAGYATLNVSDSSIDGTPHYYVEGKGETVGIFRVFPVNDFYATYINKNNSLPTKFIRKIDEGGYRKDLVNYFNHSLKEVKVENKISKSTQVYKTSDNIQDMLSSFYYLRKIDFSKINPEDFVSINVFMDEEVYPFKMKLLARETIRTKFGKINCLKLRPYVMSGRVFKAEESVTFWVTDDNNHIPVEIKAELAFGSLKAELIDYKNLNNVSDFR